MFSINKSDACVRYTNMTFRSIFNLNITIGYKQHSYLKFIFQSLQLCHRIRLPRFAICCRLSCSLVLVLSNCKCEMLLLKSTTVVLQSVLSLVNVLKRMELPIIECYNGTSCVAGVICILCYGY
jgi:hypothetical protein